MHRSNKSNKRNENINNRSPGASLLEQVEHHHWQRWDNMMCWLEHITGISHDTLWHWLLRSMGQNVPYSVLSCMGPKCFKISTHLHGIKTFPDKNQQGFHDWQSASWTKSLDDRQFARVSWLAVYSTRPHFSKIDVFVRFQDLHLLPWDKTVSW